MKRVKDANGYQDLEILIFHDFDKKHMKNSRSTIHGHYGVYIYIYIYIYIYMYIYGYIYMPWDYAGLPIFDHGHSNNIELIVNSFTSSDLYSITILV